MRPPPHAYKPWLELIRLALLAVGIVMLITVPMVLCYVVVSSLALQ